MNVEKFLENFDLHWSRLEITAIMLLLVAALYIVHRLFLMRRIILSQAISGLCLLISLVLIFSSTVFTRSPAPEPMLQLQPFWSWKRALAGDIELRQEIILNLILLFPVGILLPLTLHKRLSWWQALLIGVLISACIELGQLFMHRGLCELDDIIGNSLGCMAGAVLCSRFIRKKQS